MDFVLACWGGKKKTQLIQSQLGKKINIFALKGHLKGFKEQIWIVLPQTKEKNKSKYDIRVFK